MGTRRTFHPRSVSIVLVLALSILGLATLAGPIAVHATTPALVNSANLAGLCDGVCDGPTFTGSVGDFVLFHVFCMAGGGPTSVSDTVSSIYTNLLTNGRGSIWAGILRASGSVSFTTTFSSCQFSGSPAGAFSVEEFSGVASIGNKVKNDAATSASCSSACTDTQSITIGMNNALVYEALDDYNPSNNACPTITNGGSSQVTTQTLLCLNGLAGSWSQGQTDYAANRGIGLNSFSKGANNWNQFGHELVELDPAGGTPSNLGTQTACFGNCGNPAVTLANTNSTHTVNFNSTITLFYSFQSNLNGQVLNLTTSVAKTYSNGQQLSLGVYTVPVCSIGQPPFTPICPGLLQKSTTLSNPPKGTATFTNLNIPVSSGQWVGLALSGSFNGLDINDTNTQAVMLQTSGNLPPSITQTTSFSGVSKVSLWSYLTGNTITGIPSPTITGGGNCSGLLDCILPNLVFSLCTNQTPQCQNASALVWALLLSVIVSFFVFKGSSNLLPGVRIPIGEVFTVTLLVWIFVLSGLQLLFVWVPLFFFFVISLMLGKKTGTYL